MRELGITGAVRGKKAITTISDPTAPRAPDLIDRNFVASAPNRCGVADFTHVATFSGVVYVAFVVDTFSRRIVGWSASTTKQTRLVLDALDMGLWQRECDQHPPVPGELLHHSDAGSQYIRRSRWPSTWRRPAPVRRGPPHSAATASTPPSCHSPGAGSAPHGPAWHPRTQRTPANQRQRGELIYASRLLGRRLCVDSSRPG
ncbi:DDE-type integrase/transposase/recombinase [Streptomyces sp. NBC_01320]|uniref:DDE-type integrase/transposase/recombinase n=1 Tax=Streptomyces sp. NBC_01320 TaxID=2903824 RepID=UPI003FA3C84A